MAEASYQQYACASAARHLSRNHLQMRRWQLPALLAEANALEAETKLLAPIRARCSKPYGKASELVAMGVPVVSIIEDNDVWVSLNVREDQYQSVYTAKTMSSYIPALGQSAAFKIKHIDAEGEFATIKTTRQTGGYIIRSFQSIWRRRNGSRLKSRHERAV